jgi:Xaa-Pro dipeptidase
MSTMGNTSARQRVADVQEALRSTGQLDGWLFYDFRGSDPLAYRVLRLDPMHVTRRWYYWVPTHGDPVKIVHQIEPRTLDELPGQTVLYVSWAQQRANLADVLKGTKRLAMQYSPMNAIPYVSRVDAGTVELIRSLAIEVVTSADLVQRFEAVWDERQLASHQEAAEKLRLIVDEAFAHVGRSVASGTRLHEYGLQQFILSRIRDHGLTTASPPVAAVNAHSADPHYSPTPLDSWPIEDGSLVLIDLWAKRPEAGSVYADITWTAYVGRTVPSRHREIFGIVREARDAALAFIRDSLTVGSYPCGWEVDEVCRRIIRDAGYGGRFVHRTGHSIGEEVHGNGANIDNLETQDERRLMLRTCFSIEPGIYLAGEFGVRSEIDVYLAERGPQVYGQPIQTELIPIMA